MTHSLDTFIPPHCPRSDCRYHRSADGWCWIRYGHFSRRCLPRVIPRFRCLHCRATFSSQAFATTYYLKRPELLEPIAHRLLACSGHRQIAREARCDPTTVMGQAARLGRHALLLLAELGPSGDLGEPLVIDGFESFAYSQYHPLHLNTAVGARSHFVYGFTLARLRRKGRMTERQRQRRAQLEAAHGRPAPRAPAMRLGLTDHRWSVRTLLTGRRFVTRRPLPPSWQEYYERRIDTPGIRNPRRHTLKLAL